MYAECGGLIYLSKSIQPAPDEAAIPMGEAPPWTGTALACPGCMLPSGCTQVRTPKVVQQRSWPVRRAALPGACSAQAADLTCMWERELAVPAPPAVQWACSPSAP